MARIFYKILSERDRNIYAILLFGLNSMSTLFSIALFGISIYMFFYFTSKAHLLGEDFSFTTFSVIYLVVTAFLTIQQPVLCYVLNYSRRSANRRSLMEWGYYDLIVYSYILTALIALPAIILYSNWFVSHISYGFVDGMKTKLQKYPTNRAERVVFNNLQFEYDCCGVTGYKDWKDVLGPGDDVPFSCCKIQFSSFCYNKDVLKASHLNTINRKGCAKVFHEYIALRLYSGIGLWIVINFIHLISLILFQYWKSSAESAIKSGKPKWKSEGWLFIPFLGTYKQLMTDFKTQQNERKERKALIPKTGDKYYSTKPMRVESKEGQPYSTTGAAYQTRGFNIFSDIPDPPVTPQTYLPPSPQVSPRYHLYAPELSNQMNRICEKCGRHTFMTGNHLCLVKYPSTSLMAILDDDSSGAEESDSSSDLFNTKYHKNYQNRSDMNERGGKQSMKSPIASRFAQKMLSNQKITSTDDDTSAPEGLKRKYKERYYILKEIR